jgi:hypothetical protein
MKRRDELPTVDPLVNEARRAKHEQRLGLEPGETAACFLCGLTELDALIAVQPSLLEGHHVFGRANDPRCVRPLCRNCHAIVTAAYRDAGVPMATPATVLHKIVAMVRALGALLTLAGQVIQSIAELVIALIPRFDAEIPSWRGWQEAQA